MTQPPKISIVVPIYNEEQSLEQLHKELTSVLNSFGQSYEIIFVDDGSIDKSYSVASKLKPVSVISLDRNRGQTAALAAGIDRANGEIIVTIDSDLENDPKDIIRLISHMSENVDVVSGWRKNRWNGQFFSRKLPSVIANAIISYVTGVKLHDHGCTLKAYKRDAVKDLPITGDAHRMLAAFASLFNGAKVKEVEVDYRNRKFGRSNYGPMRSFKVLLDLFSLNFFYKYANNPIYFFGTFGFISFSLAGISFLGMIYLKFVYDLHISFIETPLPVLVALFVIVGIQFILMGLLAEIFRIKLSNPTTYKIKREVQN